MAKKLTNDDIQKAVNQQLRQATGYDEDEITAMREKAIDYYFMRPRGDEITGRSQVISGDLSAMVDAVLSQMLDAFSTDNVVEFEPNGEDDETQAQLESDTVSHFVMDANNGFMTFLAAIKDALMVRNGIIKVWVDDRTKTETKKYTDVTPIAFIAKTEVEGKVIDVVEHDADAQTLTLKETTVDRRLIVESTPLENFLYTPNWTSLDLQGIPFCAERKVDSRSSLIEQGYDKKKVNDLKAFSVHRPADSVRNPQKVEEKVLAAEPSQDQIEYYECFMLIDTDGDGVSERRRFVISDTTLLDNMLTPLVSFAAGAVLINPHRFTGISLYDKLKQTQDINTGLNRALLDNANATNKSRLVVRDGKVNPDDLDDGRVNSRIRVKNSHVGALDEAVHALLVPDISAGILANIEHQKRNRAELGGAALDLSAGNAQLASDQIGSQGMDRAYSVMEQLAAMMTKIIAESLIRNVYLLAHATLRQFFDQSVNIRQSAAWASPVPSEWIERTRVNVKIGMSVGERARKVSTLDSILGKQIALSDQGLDAVLVNITGFYATLMDWARASEVDNPEQYFIDPSSEASKQAMQDKQKEKAEADKRQIALLDKALELEQLRIALGKRSDDDELAFKYWKENLSSEVEEAKIVGKATTELEKARATTEQETATDKASEGTTGE